MSVDCQHDRMTEDHDYCPDCGEYRNKWMAEIARLRKALQRAYAIETSVTQGQERELRKGYREMLEHALQGAAQEGVT